MSSLVRCAGLAKARSLRAMSSSNSFIAINLDFVTFSFVEPCLISLVLLLSELSIYLTYCEEKDFRGVPNLSICFASICACCVSSSFVTNDKITPRYLLLIMGMVCRPDECI